MGKKKLVGVCAYCGRYTTLTEDHVIPRSLFSAPRPEDIPKVLACAKCNNVIKSFNDTYLRDLLAVDVSTVNQPAAKDLYARFLRAAHRRQSHLARDISWQVPTQLFTPSGIYLGKAHVAHLPLDRVTNAITMLVHGLYRAYTGLTLPPDVQVAIKRYYDDTDLRQVIAPLLQAGTVRVQPVGDGSVFTCIYGYAQDEPESSIWVLVFYEHAVLAVTTGPSEGTTDNSSSTNGGAPLPSHDDEASSS